MAVRSFEIRFVYDDSPIISSGFYTPLRLPVPIFTLHVHVYVYVCWFQDILNEDDDSIAMFIDV